MVRGGRRRGFEIKRTDTPHLTPSLAIARADLELDSIDVIHAGDHTFPLGDGVRAVPLRRIADDVPPLG